VNYSDYVKQMRDVPCAEGVEGSFAYLCLHMERMPIKACTLKSGNGTCVKLPLEGKNKYGNTVYLVKLSEGIFRNRRTLTDIMVSSKIRKFEAGQFMGCTELRRVTVPRNIRKFERDTFRDCDKLEDIYYEGSAEEWDAIERKQYCRKTDFGALIPGRPVMEITDERRIRIPGNEAVTKATVHFGCDLMKLYEGCHADLTGETGSHIDK